MPASGALAGNWQFMLNRTFPLPKTPVPVSGFLSQAANNLAGSVQVTPNSQNGRCGGVGELAGSVDGQTVNISINQGVGTVQATGNQRVQPNDSTTYTLTATGPGGNRTATATVSVSAPPPPPPPPPPPVSKPTLEQRMNQLTDAYYDYDKSDVRADARDALTQDANALKSILSDFPTATIMIEGHCDERGSAEYNLGLGDRRATSAKDFLVQLGVPADRLKTISYGKERPQCTESNETCWQKNRRAHFATGQ